MNLNIFINIINIILYFIFIAVIQRLLVTRYDAERAAREECLSLEDIKDLLGLDLIGVIPESPSVLTCMLKYFYMLFIFIIFTNHIL